MSANHSTLASDRRLPAAKTPTAEQIAANAARIAAIGDRGRTGDLFASAGAAEDLTLIGEAMPAPESFAARNARADAQITREEREQSTLFYETTID